jgi:NAD+ kinase
MKIAIYGHPLNDITSEFFKNLFKKLEDNNVEIFLYEEFGKFIEKYINIETKKIVLFNSHKEITKKIDFFISIGGDGTFLETVSFVRDKNIPIAGINSGRLGFLATISKENIDEAIDDLLNNNFEIEKRTLIELKSKGKLFKDFNYALNEFTIQKTYSSSMIKIDVKVDDEYLNSYWSDGLIISTPTGSTAYSLSAGGPIVVPNSKNLIITPISPHNLTARPLILSDDKQLSVTVSGRSNIFLASLDYKSEPFDKSLELKIKRANFSISVIKFKNNSFYSTLRNKLMWGADKRN